jgi:hypothetical protein
VREIYLSANFNKLYEVHVGFELMALGKSLIELR